MQHWKTTKSPDVAIRYWKLSVRTSVIMLGMNNNIINNDKNYNNDYKDFIYRGYSTEFN